MNKLFLLAISCCLIYTSQGQTPDIVSKIVTINPFGNDIMPGKIKPGSTVKFKISNVNTFKVKGHTTSKPLNLDFEVPAIFNDIFNNKKSDSTTDTNNLVGKKTDKKNGINKGMQTIIVDSLAIIKEAKLKSNFLTEFKEFTISFQNIHQYVALEDKLASKLTDSIFIRDTATLKYNAKSDYDALYNTENAKTEVTTKLNELRVSYANLSQIYDELNKTPEKDSVVLSGKLVSDDKESTAEIKKAVVKQDRKKHFAEEMAFAKKAFETLSNTKTADSVIKKAQAGIDLYHQIKNETFVVYTDAEQLNDDAVTITPVLKYANGKTATEFKPITLKTSGGIKVNFSSGYFISFKADDNYSAYKDTAGNTIGAVKGNSNKITHALGGLIHAYPRWINGPQPALSAGISLATSGSLGFYGGASLMFLEKNRLVFTVGYSYLKLKKFNTANVTDAGNDRYKFITKTDTEIKYDEVYRGAAFFSISYNLSK